MTENWDSTESATKSEVADSFGSHASEYIDSAVHAEGADLAILANWCSGATSVLDVATGAGHTAGAIQVAGGGRIIATDIAKSMVRTSTREYPELVGVVMDAEELAFRDDVFDAVTSRIAAHHFPNPKRFLREAARVISPGGVFALEDNIAPENPSLDRFLNRLETLRDPTHVRSHSVSEWREWIEVAGFEIEEVRIMKKTITYDSWIDQLDTPAENAVQIERLLRNPPDGARTLFDICVEDGDIVSFSNQKILCKATSRG